MHIFFSWEEGEGSKYSTAMWPSTEVVACPRVYELILGTQKQGGARRIKEREKRTSRHHGAE